MISGVACVACKCSQGLKVKWFVLTFFCLNGNWILCGRPSTRKTYVGEWAKGLVSTLQASIASPAIPLEASTGNPLDFLPNYPARKCLIISACEAGTVLMISIYMYCFFAQMPKGTFELEGWGKSKYCLLLKLALPRLCLGTTVQ